MQAYRIGVIDHQDDGKLQVETFKETRDEAHEVAKRLEPRADARIELVDVQNDKEGLVAMLNGQPIIDDPIRTWRISPRGGLVECPNGE